MYCFLSLYLGSLANIDFSLSKNLKPIVSLWCLKAFFDILTNEKSGISSNLLYNNSKTLSSSSLLLLGIRFIQEIAYLS